MHRSSIWNRNRRLKPATAQHVVWLLVCLAAMQLDATSMESKPISPLPELRGATGHFNSNSVIQKSKNIQAEANLCFKNNKYKEAIELFAQAIQSNPVTRPHPPARRPHGAPLVTAAPRPRRRTPSISATARSSTSKWRTTARP
jgi:hypothetical protein